MEYALVIFFHICCFYEDTYVANAKYTSGKSTHLEFFFLCIWAYFNFSGCNEKYL